jgi:hypothetical protein
MRKLAQDLDTKLSLVLTHAAKEAGWNIDHDQQLNNPFDVNKIKKGKAAGNIAYPSLEAAIDYYKARFGPNVAGSRTADDYINASKTLETASRPLTLTSRGTRANTRTCTRLSSNSCASAGLENDKQLYQSCLGFRIDCRRQCSDRCVR